MSVIMMLRLKADPDALERYAQENSELLKGIAEDGRSQGAIHHVFAADGDELVVIDEWPDEASFQGFFEGQQDIPKVMEGAGAQGEPDIRFLRVLDTGDAF
jgi:quinol monooxygenase YgiN